MRIEPFLGREIYIKQLDQYSRRQKPSLIVIKGRRRIGKSRLATEFAKNKTFYKFEGLAPDSGVTAQSQRDAFARKLYQYFPGTPELKATDWLELFEILSNNIKKDNVVILFDEISWMAISDETFLPKLKQAWDNHFKQHKQLMLILCSSISLWIEKNILSSTAFVGRVDFVMHLKELPLSTCREFWGAQQKHVSLYDQLKFLSISGGVPLYLESLNPNESVEENIRQLCFTDGSLLLREFNNIFHDLFGRRSEIYKNILRTLVKSPMNLQDICKASKSDQNGLISEYLLDLTEAGFINRDYTWKTKDGSFSKLSRFRLSDNYVRFYLRYLEPVKQKIENGQYELDTLTALPGWLSIMGLQFENLILNNRNLIWEHLNLSIHDIVIDGAYFQTQTTKQQSCQVDYMIQTRFNNLFVIELKFSQNEIGSNVIKEVEEKIKRVNKPRGFSCFPILIHVNGVSDAVIDSAYFMKIISLEELAEQITGQTI